MKQNKNTNLGCCNIIRQKTKWFKYNSNSFRMHSPRTQQACRSLGFDINTFSPKYLADFTQESSNTEVQIWAYNRWKKKLQERIKIVNAQRIKMIADQRKQTQKQEKQLDDASKSMSITTFKPFNHQLSVEEIGDFEKQVKSLRLTFFKPKQQDSDKILNLSQSTRSETNPYRLVPYLEDQINKFNKHKQLLQKEALEVYKQEIKSLQSIKESEEKFVKIEETKSKIQQEKVQKLNKMNEQAQDKINQ